MACESGTVLEKPELKLKQEQCSDVNQAGNVLEKPELKPEQW